MIKTINDRRDFIELYMKRFEHNVHITIEDEMKLVDLLATIKHIKEEFESDMWKNDNIHGAEFVRIVDYDDYIIGYNMEEE